MKKQRTAFITIGFIFKTESPTFVELLVDRGHPGPFSLKFLNADLGSAFETFVVSIPRVKNVAKLVFSMSKISSGSKKRF